MRPDRIYIAGAMAEIERAEHAIIAARALGYEATFDWPANVRAVGRPDHALTVAELRPHLRRNLEAVRSAAVHWMLTPSAGVTTVGGWVELGYQLAVTDLAYEDTGSRPTLIIASRASITSPLYPWASVFADHLFDNDVEALAFLARRGVDTGEFHDRARARVDVFGVGGAGSRNILTGATGLTPEQRAEVDAAAALGISSRLTSAKIIRDAQRGRTIDPPGGNGGERDE